MLRSGLKELGDVSFKAGRLWCIHSPAWDTDGYHLKTEQGKEEENEGGEHTRRLTEGMKVPTL